MSKYLLLSFFFIVALTGCTTGISTEEAAGLYYNLGNAYSELGKDSDAVKAYQSARRLDPSLFKVGYNLARLHIDTGRYEEGRVLLNILKDEDPENLILLEAEAWSYYKEGDTDTALEIYNRILTLHHLHPRALYNIFRLHFNQDMLEEAAESLFLLWENNVSDSGIPGKNDLLLEWCRIKIRLDLGNEALDSLLYLESEEPSVEIYILLGDIYFAKENYGLSLEYYEKAVVEEGEHQAEILFKKGTILLAVAEDEEPGLEAIEGALEAGFEDTERLKNLLEIEDFLFTEQVNEIYSSRGIDLDVIETGFEEPLENPEVE